MKTIAVKPKKPDSPRKVGERVVIYPAEGSPYYIDEYGLLTLLSPPGTPPITSEDVRRELEDFP
jgi:hypothetical protein